MTEQKEINRVPSVISSKTWTATNRDIAKSLELQRQTADLSRNYSAEMTIWRTKQTKYQKVIELRKQLVQAEKEVHEMELIESLDEEPEITNLEEQVVYLDSSGNKHEIRRFNL